MTSRILILNGPNLDLLGVREPEVYGTSTLPAIRSSCQQLADILGIKLAFEQSNHEGALVDLIHAATDTSDAIIINPAGLSFHSVALLDALQAFQGPVIELHLSNIHARDKAHRQSIQSAAVSAVICGLGPYGYTVALLAAARLVGADMNAMPAPIQTGPT